MIQSLDTDSGIKLTNKINTGDRLVPQEIHGYNLFHI
jgi:hypothetical protein